MKDKLPKLITLVVGDWSGDGHDKRELVVFRCNRTKKELEKAYRAGTEQVGFDLTEEVCVEYEDMSMPAEVAGKLKDAGIDAREVLEDEHDDDGELSFAYSYSAFAELWMRIAQLGDADLRFKLTENASPNINVGGYGLFD